MSVEIAPKYVYFFEEGQELRAPSNPNSMRNMLGGKGAGLAEMTAAGLPVPSGFTITTQACLQFYEAGGVFPSGLQDQIDHGMRELETRTGKGFGDVANPLLVSVRSGARVSMPGMMDTILNLGLNDETVAGLAKLTGNDRFAWDAYRRFIMMYSNVVLGISKELFEEQIEAEKKSSGVGEDAGLDAAAWQRLVDRFKAIALEKSGRPFPQDVREQLRGAIEAVFDSWNSRRAIDYRRFNKIPDDWGTAVNVMEMVFGNMGDDSGTGVAFTRDPNTGERVLFGEYLSNAQGEDVVAGIRTPEKIADLARRQPKIYEQFQEIATRLERHYRDVQDLEFTVERGKLFMLQTRSAKRTAEAAVKIALDLVGEGLIDKRRAVSTVNAQSLDQLFHARIDPNESAGVACKGLNASPGAAAGQIVFTADDAVAWKEQGRKTILVRTETTPDDVHGMIAAEGILTAKGGATSHAAVVARGMGKPCVAGCDALAVDRRNKRASLDGKELREGDWITIDGTTGNVAVGQLRLILPPSKLPDWLATFLSWADELRRMQVWANADTPEDAAKARELGVQGIGLCRTEHMFMQPERLPIVHQMILASTPASACSSARTPPAFSARRFRRHPQCDGGLARHNPAARSAAARVLAVARAAAGRNDRVASDEGHRLAGISRKGGDAAPRPATARTEPDARFTRLPAWDRLSRDLRDAGASDLRSGLRFKTRGARPPARSDDSRGRHQGRDAVYARRGQTRRRRGVVTARGRACLPHRYDDRTAAGLYRRRRARRVR